MLISRCAPYIQIVIATIAASYLLTFDLESFPPYFFCDEAIAGLDADSLIRTGRDIHGVRWPVSFRGLGDFALSLTVYLQIPFNLLFGMTEFSVRIRTVLMSLLGAGSLSWLMWRLGERSLAWIPLLVCTISPLWFLHSRTGFEYVSATSFYLIFATSYIYCLHREKPNWLVLSSIAAVACFYSYTPARGWILVASFLLAVINVRFHIKYKKHTLWSIAIAASLLAPFAVFTVVDPAAALKRFSAVGVGGFLGMTLWQQIVHVLSEYCVALDPAYWLSTTGAMQDAGERHFIPGLSAIPFWLAPLLICGVVAHIRRLPYPAERSVLCLLFAIPLPAALVEINHERAMPVGVIYIAISIVGIVWLAQWAAKNSFLTKQRISALLMAGLLFYSAYFHLDVHSRARFGYSNYGFYGTQSGAKQIFNWVNERAIDYGTIRIDLAMFNSTQELGRFYMPAAIARMVEYSFFDDLCNGREMLTTPQVWISARSTVEQVRSKGCPLKIHVITTFAAPTGVPLHDVTLVAPAHEYPAWVEETIKVRALRRNTQLVSVIHQDGRDVLVRYPPLAMGKILDLFDENEYSIVRVDEINPSTFILEFPPQILRELQVVVANTSSAIITVEALSIDGITHTVDPVEYVKNRGDDPHLRFALPNQLINSIKIVVILNDSGPSASPHIAEMRLS